MWQNSSRNELGRNGGGQGPWIFSICIFIDASDPQDMDDISVIPSKVKLMPERYKLALLFKGTGSRDSF
jgi:hypothetical protein